MEQNIKNINLNNQTLQMLQIKDHNKTFEFGSSDKWLANEGAVSIWS